MKKLRNVHCICCDAFVVLISSKERAAAKEPPNEEQYRLILVNERACKGVLGTRKLKVVEVGVEVLLLCRLDLAGIASWPVRKSKEQQQSRKPHDLGN